MSMDEHVMVVSNGSTHRDGDGGSSDGDGRDVVMELASNHENYAKKMALVVAPTSMGMETTSLIGACSALIFIKE
jgi:hypothetical protein